jgi:hypothetical protein
VKRRAFTPALAVNGCGCFLPDLTRLTTPRCGGARLRHNTSALLTRRRLLELFAIEPKLYVCVKVKAFAFVLVTLERRLNYGD